MKNESLAVWLTPVITTLCFAQSQFIRTVGGPYEDYGYSVVQTSDNGFAVVGSTRSFGAGSWDLLLVKFTSSGSLEWSCVLGGVYEDYGYSIVHTNDNGFAVAGARYRGGGEGWWNLYLVKFNPSGALEWYNSVVGASDDYGYSIVQTNDSGFAVAGYTQSFGAGGNDLFLAKFSSSGAFEWARTVGGTGDDKGFSVVQMNDNGFVVAGNSGSFGAGSNDLFLVKFSSSGAFEWARTVGGTGDDRGYSVAQTSDAGFAVTGWTQSFGASWDWNLFLMKFNSSGGLEWTRVVGGTGVDGGYSVVQTRDGGLAVTGLTQSYGVGTPDSANLLLTKFSPSGTLEWAYVLGGTGKEFGRSIIQTSDSGFAVAGMATSFGAGISDLLLVKFDAGGNTCQGNSVSPTVSIVSPSIATPSPTITIVSPTLTTISPATDYVNPTFSEICTQLDITETISNPQSIEISVNPNPFNSSCAISAQGAAKIEIYNLQGKKVAQLGENERTWTPDKELGGGIYLVKATTKDGQSTTKRVVFMK